MFSRLLVQPLTSANYLDAIPGIDNQALDTIIFRNIDVALAPLLGHFLDERGAPVPNSNALNASLENLEDQYFYFDLVQFEKHRVEFEKNLVIAFNSLNGADGNKSDSWSDLSNRELLRLMLGYILDKFYKNTAVTGKYVDKFEKIQNKPAFALNLQSILAHPHYFIDEQNKLCKGEDENITSMSP